MAVSVKDVFKFVGVTVVCFCAVFVCTVFFNYCLDVYPLGVGLSPELVPLYDAQLASAKLSCGVTGGMLSATAAAMLIFYIKLYTDSRCREIGTLKALGYSNGRIARGFAVFGLNVFIGCALGFGGGWAAIPYVYGKLSSAGIAVSAEFHAMPLLCLVVAPTVVLGGFAPLCAWFSVRRPALELIKGERKNKPVKPKRAKKYTDRPFLKELCYSTLKSRKSLAFFVALSGFCFSATVQMGLSMNGIAEGSMGLMVLTIGCVIAVVAVFMAMTALVQGNAKNIAVLKVTGYSSKEIFTAVFAAYIPIAVIGFALGTVYQFGLLSLIVNIVFEGVRGVKRYEFDVPALFTALASFVVLYSLVFFLFVRRANKVPVKEIMLET